MNQDTKLITFSPADNIIPNPDDFDWSEDHVRRYVERTSEKLSADSDFTLSLPLKFREFNCSEIAKGNSHSKTAYIETEQGYFFVTKAYPDYVNVLYSRWD